jgi:hypothetical protein
MNNASSVAEPVDTLLLPFLQGQMTHYQNLRLRDDASSRKAKARQRIARPAVASLYDNRVPQGPPIVARI